MILGNTNLYKSCRVESPKFTVESNYEDRSLFIESLDMIRENDRFFNSVLKKVHSKVALSEATQKNTVYLQEFSFTEMIKNIIDFFIDAVKNLWAKFKNLFHKITYSDKTIEKYADRLKDMKGDFTVTFPRYIYTCFDEDIPSINLKNTFYDDYSILEGKIKEIADLKTKTERCEKFRALEADVKAEVSPAYYDTVRSKTIGTTYMITSSYYASELFNKFRDGGKETTSKIDPTEVTNTLNRYQNNKTLIKQLEKAKTDTINAAKDIRKKIESIALQNVNKYYTPYDAEEETLFNKILQTKSGQVNEVCNIYVMAFSAKLDAAKESAIQDKKVLFEAIKFINSDFGR